MQEQGSQTPYSSAACGLCTVSGFTLGWGLTCLTRRELRRERGLGTTATRCPFFPPYCSSGGSPERSSDEAEALLQRENRAQHMEAEFVLRAQELQRVNEQLRTSEERYRKLLQTVPPVEHHGQWQSPSITTHESCQAKEALKSAVLSYQSEG